METVIAALLTLLLGMVVLTVFIVLVLFLKLIFSIRRHAKANKMTKSDREWLTGKGVDPGP